VKVLITGATGQVGRALLDIVPIGTTAIGLSHHDLDITDERRVADCLDQHRPDVIINAAAYTAVDRAESEPDLARKVNADGPRCLAQAARPAGPAGADLDGFCIRRKSLQALSARCVHESSEHLWEDQACRRGSGAPDTSRPMRCAAHGMGVCGEGA